MSRQRRTPSRRIRGGESLWDDAHKRLDADEVYEIKEGFTIDKEIVPVNAIKTGTNVYYGAKINNNELDINPTKLPRAAKFFESRDTPIFQGKPVDWMISVVRFDIPTQLIPIQLFPTIDGTNLDSDYGVTIEYNGVQISRRLTWIPQDLTAAVPFPGATASQKQTDFYQYYSMYSYKLFAEMITTAFQEAIDYVGPPFPSSPLPPGTVGPLFSYDPLTLRFTLYGSLDYTPQSLLPFGQIKLYFNSDLMGNFLNTMQSIHVTNVQSPTIPPLDFRNWQLVVENQVTNGFVLPAPYGAVFGMLQEFQALSLLNSFQSMVLKTGSIPIVPEWSSVYQANNLSRAEGILADFQVQYTSGIELHNQMQYLPTAEFRRISIDSKDQLSTIDLQFFWRPKNSTNLIPVLIPFYSVADVKILFEKK